MAVSKKPLHLSWETHAGLGVVWRVVGSWWHFDTSIIQTEKSAKQVQQDLRGAISQHSRNPGPTPPPGTLNHSATADILDRFLHGKPLLPVQAASISQRPLCWD